MDSFDGGGQLQKSVRSQKYKVPEETKPVNGDRNQNSSYFLGQRGELTKGQFLVWRDLGGYLKYLGLF